MEAKAGDDARKRRKLVKRKPPEFGYAPWNEDTFRRLVEGTPEPLVSSFGVSHQMLLNLLDRPGDGCGAVRALLTDNHEPRARQRSHIRRAIAMYRALVDAEVVEQLDEPDTEGRTVRVTIDLQDDFALTQPLSLFAVEAIDALEPDHPDYALDVLSVVEAVLDDPRPVLKSQLDRVKNELIARLKADGVDYDDRMAELAEAEYPKPLRDYLWAAFVVFRRHHPWVGEETPRPKSVARELYEMGYTFHDYVRHHGLKRSEGVLLRYLTDAYKGLVQNVPDRAKTDELDDLEAWLGELVRQVDSSMLDEWERIQAGTDLEPFTDGASLEPGDGEPERRDVTANRRAFGVMVRNEAFRWVGLFARRDHAALAELPAADGGRWRSADLEDMAAPYWETYDSVLIDADARSGAYFSWDPGTGAVTQILCDPQGHNEWRLRGRVDPDASRAEGRAVVALVAVESLG